MLMWQLVPMPLLLRHSKHNYIGLDSQFYNSAFALKMESHIYFLIFCVSSSAVDCSYVHHS